MRVLFIIVLVTGSFFQAIGQGYCIPDEYLNSTQSNVGKERLSNDHSLYPDSTCIKLRNLISCMRLIKEEKVCPDSVRQYVISSHGRITEISIRPINGGLDTYEVSYTVSGADGIVRFFPRIRFNLISGTFEE